MATAFQELLSIYCANSKTNREQGVYFEKLVMVFLENDKEFAPQFTRIQTFAQWATQHGKSGIDTGVDLVATNVDDFNESGEPTYTAIQCKFYMPLTSISKAGIDSFMSASDRKYFTRRILFDTTNKALNKVIQSQLDSSSRAFTRVTLSQFENSSIDWEYYNKTGNVKHKHKKHPLPHQKIAIENTRAGFALTDRGKLIMACGTGKTYTALKIAEDIAGKNKSVLFLVPSLALMSQTITEWSIETDLSPLNAFAVCSDVSVGKRKSKDDDISDITTHDLSYPATTNAKTLASKINKHAQDRMTVVFATYQSIAVIHDAQAKYNMKAFDLIICDEAHRTTGATLAGADDSHFVKIHDNNYIQGNKRLYMTATPRVYIETVKTQAKIKKADLYSMDDISMFGVVFYSLKFGDAVEAGLLSDYKVIILVIDEDEVALDIQSRLSTSEEGLQLGDATKMIGCYKALVKHKMKDQGLPMKKAVAFCKSIKASKLFKDEFAKVIDAYLEANKNNDKLEIAELECLTEHVDGKMTADEKNQHLAWLKDSNQQECRILTNARCLAEGVDVPSLDAVMFIHGRKSKVDIVQSVGRVMRRAEGKQLGYVIIPVAIKSNEDTAESLNNNEKYQIVWDIVNALRSHDERLDANINQVALADTIAQKEESLAGRIEIVVAIDKLPTEPKDSDPVDKGDDDPTAKLLDDKKQKELDLAIDSVSRAVLAKIVEKCGTRTYWEDWAIDVARIANNHITRIKATLHNKDSKEYAIFNEFVHELKDNLNESITADEVIEMLAQHIITRPVFNALFSDYNFADNNSISQSMQSVLDVLDAHHIANEQQSLERFYESVKRRADGINSADAKQKIILELYDKFFRKAFPRMTERLGIVYTPVECVDFIIHSVNDVLKQEFNQSLGDRNTHIIDPFTGTGTFITRLMQSGLLTKEQLEYKYNLQEKTITKDGIVEKIKTTEIHANELVLLAYYIASINIEAVYHAIVGGDYKSFAGICLTDTFQLNEHSEDLITPQLADNNHRRKLQRKLPIRVIIGNPPYSVGQKNSNDNNQNIRYKKLDASISHNYLKNATGNKNNYDSYIRAIRWASDRIDKYGIIGFITNSGYIHKNSMSDMRENMLKEFSSIYVIDLKGAIRGKAIDESKKEGQSVFDIMTGVAITIFVKNPDAIEHGKISYYDIGDYLSRKDKLNKLTTLASIANITDSKLWQEIMPDQYNDWLLQRESTFYNYACIGDKKDRNGVVIFDNYSNGIVSNRDAWVYNYSKAKLVTNVSNMITFYNNELERYNNSDVKNHQPSNAPDAEKYIAHFVIKDKTKISWSSPLPTQFVRSKYIQEASIDYCLVSLYRPFTKGYLYNRKEVLHSRYTMPLLIPEANISNKMIICSGVGSRVSFSVIMSNLLPDLELITKCCCFPMYLYEPINSNGNHSLLDAIHDDVIVTAPSSTQYRQKDAITDAGLKHFADYYQDSTITKEDLFYYIYGILHSSCYKDKYANNLTKSLPHIPRVKTIADFMAYSTAGRSLARLHLDYEQAELYPVTFSQDITNLANADFYVHKMKFANKNDKSKIIYNDKITISAIPLQAYQYVVNGKSAIDWVMERQGVSTDKDSGITNDANDWANETMQNAKYPLELLQRIITVSIKTMQIIDTLPKLDC